MTESTTTEEQVPKQDIGSLVGKLSKLNSVPKEVGTWSELKNLKNWQWECRGQESVILTRKALIEYFGKPEQYKKDKISKDMKKAIKILNRFSIFAMHGQEVFGKKVADDVMEVAVIYHHGLYSDRPDNTPNYSAATYRAVRIEHFDRWK